MANLALTRAFLQLEQCTHPPPPVPPFLLVHVQNLSSKQIVPTDNMQPKPDDAKRRHQFLIVIKSSFDTQQPFLYT